MGKLQLLEQTKMNKTISQLYKSERLFIHNTNSMWERSHFSVYEEEELVLLSPTSFLQRGQVALILSHLSTQST